MTLTVVPTCWLCGDDDGPFGVVEFTFGSFLYCERCLSGDES